MRDMDVKLLAELTAIIPEPETVSENDTRAIEEVETTTKTVRRTKK